MKKVAIVGAKGTIGTVLVNGLESYNTTALDLPELDATDYSALKEALEGHDAVIHLAWDNMVQNFLDKRYEPRNSIMTANVYKAAVELKIKRVIMASSVHADDFSDWQKQELIDVNKTPWPDSPYGANKVFMEALGRFYAQDSGLEVVCIRFGGVNSENKPPEPNDKPGFDIELEHAVWFSHNDCVSLVEAILKAESIPANYSMVYGVSNNGNRIHDFSNPFGWEPQERAEDFK